MATQNNEPLTTASSRASLVDYPDVEKSDKRSRRRACPLTALLGLLLHFVISCSGVAISVLIVNYDLQVPSEGILDLVARVLLFVASSMGIFYVLMHAFAAREHYIRSHGSPQIFGYFTVAVAVLIMRLGVPVWTASVVLTSSVAAFQGFHSLEGLRGNIVWIQLVITSLGLVSLIVIVVITETTERPFATSLFSKTSFIRAPTTSLERVNTFDLSVSRAGYLPRGNEEGEGKSKERTDLESNHTGFDRARIDTPESSDPASVESRALGVPAQDKIVPLVRVRSQPIPTPLEAVFTSEGSPLDAQDSPRKLAWHPIRDSKQAPQMPQVAAVSLGAIPPLTPRPPSSASQQESSSQRSSVQIRLVLESDEDSTRSDADSIMSPSPALGTPIAFSTGAPLRIANPDEDPVQQEEPPTLAKLLGQLSTRAAARRRNSLLVRQAESAIRQDTDQSTIRAGSRTDMAAVLFDQPDEYVEAAREDPVRRRNSLLVRQADLDVRRSISVSREGAISVFSPDPSTEFVEIPRPPGTAKRAEEVVEDGQTHHPPRLMRNNTADPLLIRNFSRPGVPRPRTAGGEEHDTTHTRASDQRGRKDKRQEKAMARRSRSLPPVRQHLNTTAADESLPNENISASRNKASQPLAAPRFSPFPKTAIAPPPFEFAKVKGLGQGSTKRLDDRIEKWMDEVPLGQT